MVDWYWLRLMIFIFIPTSLMLCNENPSDAFGQYEYIDSLTNNLCFTSENDITSGDLNKYVNSNITRLVQGIKNNLMNPNEIPKSRIGNFMTDENPNLKQALMSRAFIGTSNLAFQKNDINEEIDGIVADSKNMFKFDKLQKTNIMSQSQYNRRSKRDISKVCGIIDENNYKGKSGINSEMRVHCTQVDPTEVVCNYDNFTYSFKLPAELINKNLMETLIASVCSIVEEASEGIGGTVALKVDRNYMKKVHEDERDVQDNSNELKLQGNEQASPSQNNKVVRINIPIDFNAIPIDINEDKERLEDNNLEKQINFFSDRLKPPTPNNVPLREITVQEKLGERIIGEDDHFYQPLRKINFDESNLRQMNHIYDQDKHGDSNEIQVGDKWLKKRDNVNQMVFPPSLILLKQRSLNDGSDKQQSSIVLTNQDRSMDGKAKQCKHENLKDFVLNNFLSNTCSSSENKLIS